MQSGVHRTVTSEMLSDGLLRGTQEDAVETPMESGFTPVHIAAQHGHVEVVRVLHELGANVETPNENGSTPVYVAAEEG